MEHDAKDTSTSEIVNCLRHAVKVQGARAGLQALAQVGDRAGGVGALVAAIARSAILEFENADLLLSCRHTDEERIALLRGECDDWKTEYESVAADLTAANADLADRHAAIDRIAETAKQRRRDLDEERARGRHQDGRFIAMARDDRVPPAAKFARQIMMSEVGPVLSLYYLADAS